MNHSIDIYFFSPSPPSRAALLLIKALGIKHNVKVTNVAAGEQLTPEFLKREWTKDGQPIKIGCRMTTNDQTLIGTLAYSNQNIMNPLHTIPVIDDNGFILYDSHVIMKYLVDQYAKDDSLYPRDAKKGAIVNLRLFFDASYLFPRFVDFFVPTLFYDLPPDEEKKKKLEEALNHLDNFLEKDQWVAGSNMTIADFSIITVVATTDACGAIDLRKYNHLWQWYQRAQSAMASFEYEQVMHTGAQMFGGMYKSKLNNK